MTFIHIVRFSSWVLAETYMNLSRIACGVQTDLSNGLPYPFVAFLPYQGSCIAKQQFAVSIKLERSWVAVFRFGIVFLRVLGVVRITIWKSRLQGMLMKQSKSQFVKRVCSLLMVNKHWLLTNQSWLGREPRPKWTF